MQFYKFKKVLTLALFSLCLSAEASFTLSACLDSSSELTISHKVKPFGLLERTLSIKKERCILNVSSVSYKVMKSSWQIDVCRSPVHIKKTDGGIEVVKKESACEVTQGTAFCEETATLLKAIQDDGLIFAEGEKSNLSSDHGQVNCAYLLLEQYLRRDKVFGEMTAFELEDERKQEAQIPPASTPMVPVPVYKDSSNPELETTPSEVQNNGQKKEDSTESSNVSW